MTTDDNVLRQTLVAESVAGDSAVAHATAYAQLREKLADRKEAPATLDRERAIALELERMAMHIADTGALCMDVGYQLGQVACEALRTVTINTTQAIDAVPFTLDLGRCLFCGECARIAPRAIRFTNDYRIGSPTREGLRLAPGMDRVPFDPAAVREQIVTTFGRALKLRQVSAGGDASVEMELNATGNVNFDFGRYGVEFTASPRHADGVVLTGPVTANMAEALDICYDAVAEPKLLIVCGSEACSGGLYAASRAVDRSFFERRHVDLWLPGAPTHPMTFIDGIRTLLRKKQR